MLHVFNLFLQNVQSRKYTDGEQRKRISHSIDEHIKGKHKQGMFEMGPWRFNGFAREIESEIDEGKHNGIFVRHVFCECTTQWTSDRLGDEIAKNTQKEKQKGILEHSFACLVCLVCLETVLYNSVKELIHNMYAIHNTYHKIPK